MPDDDITVHYSSGSDHIEAYIRVESDDTSEPDEVEGFAGTTRWIRLGADDVTSEAFTHLLESNMRATDAIAMWCDWDVWLKLLKLLGLHQPLPPIAHWPVPQRPSPDDA
jgi:hypothetical protein